MLNLMAIARPVKLAVQLLGNSLRQSKVLINAAIVQQTFVKHVKHKRITVHNVVVANM